MFALLTHALTRTLSVATLIWLLLFGLLTSPQLAFPDPSCLEPLSIQSGTVQDSPLNPVETEALNADIGIDDRFDLASLSLVLTSYRRHVTCQPVPNIPCRFSQATRLGTAWPQAPPIPHYQSV
jgi:hypothetical protein